MSAYTALSLAVDVSAHHSTASASLQNTCDTLPCYGSTTHLTPWQDADAVTAGIRSRRTDTGGGGGPARLWDTILGNKS